MNIENASRHALVRAQQRSIPPLVIDLLLRFGQSERSAGADKYFFDKAARRRLQAYAGSPASQLNDHLDAYAVVSNDDRLITVGYRSERIKRS